MTAAPRVERHRRKRERAGYKRVEVTVPAQDAALLRRAAARLRAGGAAAVTARAALDAAVADPSFKVAQTGEELVRFFRESPFVGEDVDFPRDTTIGRPIDID